MSEAPKKDHTWIYVGVVFALFWAVYLILLNPREGPDPPQLKGTGLPVPADYSWKLEDLDGKPVDMSGFRGRPIVLNLWATWCGPCRQEMPYLVKLAAEPRLKGVTFLCVTNEKSRESVKKYAQSSMKGLTVLYGEDVPSAFATEAIPATFVISADGSIVASEVGAARWDDPTVVDFLEALLKKVDPARS